MDDVLDSQKVELTQDKQQDDLNKKEENVVKLGDKAMDWLEKTFRPKKNTAKKVDPLIEKLEELIKPEENNKIN